MFRNETLFRLSLIAASVLFTLILGEVGLRLFSFQDRDGNIYVGSFRVKPFHLPLNTLKTKLEKYVKSEQTYFLYDQDLGWTVGPNGEFAGGLYISNASGIRTSSLRKETASQPLPGTLRIAIFGDSFTHGDNVPYEDSWGAILEAQLNQMGHKVEVLNLGGPGYGMDQAFLRWKKHGNPLKADIVIFGFQKSNVKRNMNILRFLYSPESGIIFSKPRFVLEGDHLRLVNVPTLRPENLINTLKNFNSWELKEHEFFFQAGDYTDRPLYASRLAAFVITGLTTKFSTRRKDYDFFAPNSTSRKLAWRLIQEFEREVTQEGAHFVMVHLPTKTPIKKLMKGKSLSYQGLLDDIMANYDLIDPAPGLVHEIEVSSLEALFEPESSHYSARANRVIGKAVAKMLLVR
ncbi:MAG: SGNH/GDSL hydrolase family protein [Nitrospirae bacterium]|nr:SGNH/GDSL hydrolase family protein [Nitrospirota bacterium]